MTKYPNPKNNQIRMTNGVLPASQIPIRSSLVIGAWTFFGIWVLGPWSFISLNASFLRRPASIVRQRRHVLDRLDGQAGGLKGGDRRLAARPGAFHFDFDF